MTKENKTKQEIKTHFKNTKNWEENFSTLSFEVSPENNLKVLRYLKEVLHFSFLVDLCGIHYPEKKNKELAIVYHLSNLKENIFIRFKIFVPITNPKVFTATSLFQCANWMERETYDFFGIEFIGHPNLKRILNVEEMTYFPLRKEYPLEDQTRKDKDDEMFGRGGKEQNILQQ